MVSDSCSLQVALFIYSADEDKGVAVTTVAAETSPSTETTALLSTSIELAASTPNDEADEQHTHHTLLVG